MVAAAVLVRLLAAAAAVGAAIGAPSPLDQVFETIAADSAALQSAAAASLLNAVLAGSRFATQPISVTASASPLQLDPNNNCPAPPTVVQTYMNDMFLSFGVRWGRRGTRRRGGVPQSLRPCFCFAVKAPNERALQWLWLWASRVPWARLLPLELVDCSAPWFKA